MYDNIFPARIKELRVAANQTQLQLGFAIGLSKQAINDMEKGRSTTTLDRIILLADYFNVSIDYLVGRIDDPATNYQSTHPSDSSNHPITQSDQYEEELLTLYRSMSEMGRGKLVERARIITEKEQADKTMSNTNKNIGGRMAK